MGGGVGVSIHGKYRVITEKIIWAMPENSVGFFPDVGSTHFLSHCPGFTGVYLGLTGARLAAVDCMYCEIGTHYVESKLVGDLENSLHSLDISTPAHIEAILAKFSGYPQGKSVLKENRDAIDRCFSGNSVEDILELLSKENTEWAQSTTSLLSKGCPMSLKVTLEALRRAKSMTLEEALQMELRVGSRLVLRQDIQEGVNAVLVAKKRHTQPKWDPPTLQDIKQEDVMKFFLPFKDPQFELQFK